MPLRPQPIRAYFVTLVHKRMFFILPLILCLFSAYSQNKMQDSFAQGATAVLRQIHVPEFKKTRYLITSYGAIADGKTDCKPVFDRVIALCSDSGGGQVVVPKGRFFVGGPLVLKSHVDVHLEEGATLIFSGDPRDYLPVVLTKWEGTELFNYSPLIYAYECRDVAITGKGHIDGSAKEGFARWRPQGSRQQDTLRAMGSQLVPVAARVFGERAHFPPSMIQFWGCENVLVEGVTITDAPYWVIHPVYCNNVTVRGVIIRSLNLNNDGCDPESSSNVLIEDCDFEVGDDAIALKAGRDQDAWRIGRPTENVIVRHCTFRSKTNGLCIGSEMSGGVRHIYFEDVHIQKCYSAVYFKSNLDRGGYIEEVHVKNISCDSATSACIRFENNYHGGRGGHYPTLFRNFSIENVRCRHAGEVGIYAVGIPGTPLQNIHISQVEIQQVPQAQVLAYVQGLQYHNVHVNAQLLTPKLTAQEVKLHTD
jgi:polygalacturonase